MKLWVNICRVVLAVTFILSGFVKAVDPLGTKYKIADYAAAMHMKGLMPDVVALVLSVALSATEFCLGIFLLFAIQRRLTSRAILALLLMLTPLTLWLAIANPVSDCGCFGDAVVLTNWQTFWKNVALLVMAAVVAWRPKFMFRFVSQSNQWIVINYSALFILAIEALSLYDLPMFDFRPYHIGANIREGMQVPEGAEQPQFQTTFIMEKDGERREFGVDDYPDSTWTFVDSRTVQTSQGYVPPIHDFSLTVVGGEQDGEDITEEVLADTSYTMLLVMPHVETADDSRLDLINELYEYCTEQGYAFYGVTASGPKAVGQWCEATGAEYPFCSADEITLKTIIRSNPGLVVLKDAVVIAKRSRNDLPHIDEAQAALPLERLALGQLPATDAVAEKILKLLLWFVLPLALLTFADRTWMWTKWLRHSKKKSRATLPEDSETPDAPLAPSVPEAPSAPSAPENTHPKK